MPAKAKSPKIVTPEVESSEADDLRAQLKQMETKVTRLSLLLDDTRLECDQVMTEARGIAWCELYGSKIENGVRYNIKINLTQRSSVSSVEALKRLVDALTVAREEYNLRPYVLKHGAVDQRVQHSDNGKGGVTYEDIPVMNDVTNIEPIKQ
jgi:hypothetical protein